MQMGKQLRIHPKALYITSGVLLVFAMIPGLPKLPFIAVGFALAFLGFRMDQAISRKKRQVRRKRQRNLRPEPETLEDLLPIELIELQVGYGLVNLVDAEQSGDLLERITHIRKQFALDWGVIIPSVKIKDNLELKPGGYSVRVKGIEVAKGELMSDHYLAILDPGSVIEPIDGIETTEPVFGATASLDYRRSKRRCWIQWLYSR